MSEVSHPYGVAIRDNYAEAVSKLSYHHLLEFEQKLPNGIMEEYKKRHLNSMHLDQTVKSTMIQYKPSLGVSLEDHKMKPRIQTHL